MKILENKDMTNQTHEVSFEAFLELVAMTRFDSTAERDKHWKSIQGFCSACNIDYDFVLKQETAMAESNFLVSILGVKNESFHVPGMYKESKGEYKSKQFRYNPVESEIKTISMKDIAKPYKGISREVIKELYHAYYRYVYA